MNKKMLAASLIIIVSIGGGLIYLLTSDSGKQAKDDMVSRSGVQQTESEGPQQQVPENTNTQQGKYIDYEEGVIASTEGTKLLFFHASWCPQCRALDADIVEQGVPGGTTIIKVDYDSNQALRQKYGVTQQTTLVRVDDNGEEVKKFVAYSDPSLDAVIKNLL